jgi:hypothetical protein
MKRRLKGRSHYYPGSLYGIALSMPVLFVPLIMMLKAGIITSKASPAMIIVTIAFIIVYMIFSKLGVKIFAFTENLFMSSGDAQKAHRKAVITEFLAFFGFIGLICVVMPMII